MKILGNKGTLPAPGLVSTPTVALKNKPTAASYQIEGILIRFDCSLLRWKGRVEEGSLSV